jgi:hypothetical protein
MVSPAETMLLRQVEKVIEVEVLDPAAMIV